jgi:hypothetical protein
MEKFSGTADFKLNMSEETNLEKGIQRDFHSPQPRICK